MRLGASIAAALSALLLVVPAQAQIDPATLRPVGYHPSEVAYFNVPYLGNSLALNGEWFAFDNNDFGTKFDYTQNPGQFVNGYPQSLGTSTDPNATNNHGPFLRALLFGTNINNNSVRPPEWPFHDNLAKGRYVVEWIGTADIRLKSGTIQLAESTGNAATGSFTNGRRVYICNGAPESLEIRALTGALTDLKVWLPVQDDPATPGNESLTGTLEDQLFHPLFLQRIADANWSFIRFMDWGRTNSSPQQDWADRRLPNHIFQAGVISGRSPLEPLTTLPIDDRRETGVAYEHMIALCNATNKNLWINVPHLATADYMTKLAQLIRFGSNGVNPFTTPTVSPAFPPLNPGLKVYVEYSNEIWSNGGAFLQGNWAEAESELVFGNSDPNRKAKFNARKFCDTWSIFQDVFDGDTSRLIRVAATFTGNNTYSDAFLGEIGTYGPTLDPPVRPDVLAVTTYFGNDIQGFVNDQGFTVGHPFGDSYWQSDLFATHKQLAFDEWKRRILAGDSASGSGPDATGTSGGFDASLRNLAKVKLPAICSQAIDAPPCLPLIAYEGGPSIFTNEIDTDPNSSADDGVTIFMEAMNRDPRIAEGYRMHLDLAKSKGLWTHNPYTDSSQWSRFGQWGHLELLEQPPLEAPKYALMLEHYTLYSTLRHIDAALNAVPSFVTAATLPTGIAGNPYTTTITTSGGNGARSVAVVGSLLDAGLSMSATSDSLTITGTPITSRKNFILARVQDADGDPAWRTFTLQTFGGPGTLVLSNFAGTNPSASAAFTSTFVLDPSVTWAGWVKGPGIVQQDGDDAFFFSVSGAPGEPGDTLSDAITDGQFLSGTVKAAAGTVDLRGAEIRFSIRRVGDHSPRTYTLFTSVGGFTLGAQLFSASVDGLDKTDTEHVLTLPNASGFSAINSTAGLEIRIYGSSAKFDGHLTSLTGFKLTAKQPLTVTTLSPSAGPTAGGQKVIITGADLAGVTSVTFGGTGATIGSATATSIAVDTPPGAAGSVNVVVTTPAGSRTLTGAYRFLSVPAISSILPASGSTAGGTSVTIGGTNLGNAISVTIGGVPAPITSNTATALVVVTPAHAAGAVNVVVTTAGGSTTSTNGYTYTVPGAPAVPTGVLATATSASVVNITWNAVAGATSYQVDRKTAGGSFTQFATPSTNSVSDTSRPADTAFLYRVRAVGPGGVSGNSASDLATTTIFVDPTLSGVPVKAQHLAQLRTAVNAVRALNSLGAFSFTGAASSGTVIAGLHVAQLRQAVDEARGPLGFSTAGYTDASLTSVVVKAVHFTELRDRVK